MKESTVQSKPDVPVLKGIVPWQRRLSRVVCDPVTEFHAELALEVEQMKQVMFALNGIGISAPQCGLWKRVSICNVLDDGKPANLVVVNPEILKSWGEELPMEEGCLSLPAAHGVVHRPRHVLLRFQDLDGVAREVQYNDMEARIVQHEVDHLNGVFFIDHLSGLNRELQLGRFFKYMKGRR